MVICKYLYNKHPTKFGLWSVVEWQMKTSTFKVQERAREREGGGGCETGENRGRPALRLILRLFSSERGNGDLNGAAPPLRTAPATGHGHPCTVWETRMGFVTPRRERRKEPHFG